MTMEREEAIKTLQHCGTENYCPHYIGTGNCYGCNRREALDMAIEALKADAEQTEIPQYEEWQDEFNKMCESARPTTFVADEWYRDTFKEKEK